MKYIDFVSIMSSARIGRYLAACGGDTRKAMTLYRKNLQLSQELFTVLSCFEVALRNSIDKHYLNTLGQDWLKNAASLGGIFANQNCKFTASAIYEEAIKLGPNYNHAKLVASLGFGFWRFLFSDHQYRAGGQNLIQIFINRPQSTPLQNYNGKYFFNQLIKINDVRNRMAHHEPICFQPGTPIKDTLYAREHYNLIIQLFQWMNIDENALLYGLDHINSVCNEIDNL
jgi:hypothetical protein